MPAMFEEAFSAAIRLVRGYTAVRAWAVEVLAVFVALTVGRFGLAVWMFDAALAGAGVGFLPGVVPAAVVGATGGDAGIGVGAGGGPWWVAWLYAYDNLRAYAENAIILGMIFAFVFEGGFMFLARKRIRLSKEEVRAELQPQLDAVKAENRELREQQAQRDAGVRAELDAALAAAAEAQATTAQATAQMEVMQAEKRLMQERQALRDEEVRMRQALRDEEVRILRERQALRDEENRLLRERVSQLENGNAAGNGNGAGAGNHG